MAKGVDLPWVPELYLGPWTEKLTEFAEGKTLIQGDNIREGFVVKPLQERFEPEIGRCIQKEYLLKKKRGYCADFQFNRDEYEKRNEYFWWCT